MNSAVRDNAPKPAQEVQPTVKGVGRQKPAAAAEGREQQEPLGAEGGDPGLLAEHAYSGREFFFRLDTEFMNTLAI